MLNPSHIKKIKESEEGRELIKYIGHTILSLDTIGGINRSDPVAAAIEIGARDLAAEKLKTIFSALLSVEELAKIKDERDDYSLTVE